MWNGGRGRHSIKYSFLAKRFLALTKIPRFYILSSEQMFVIIQTGTPWAVLKKRLIEEGTQLLKNCKQLKMKAADNHLKSGGHKAMAKKKKKEITIRSSTAEYLTYIAATGIILKALKCVMKTKTSGLHRRCCNVYDVEIPTINYHIKKVFDDMELVPEATIRKFLIVQTEGNRQVSRDVEHYNLQ